MDKKIISLIFFLSIELLTVGILTISNSLAKIESDYDFDVYLTETNTDTIDIKTTLNATDVYEKDIEVTNKGNIDALIDDYKIIGNKDNLKIEIDNLDSFFYKDNKTKIKIKIKLKDGIQSADVDLGICFIFKEL